MGRFRRWKLVLTTFLTCVIGSLPAFTQNQPVDPPHSTLQAQETGQDSFEELSRKAGEARQQSRNSEAAELYREALELNPEWSEGWWYRGVLEYEANRFVEGRHAFRVMTQLQPDLGPAWLLLGLCQFGLQDYESALSSISLAISKGVAGNRELLFTATLHKAILLTRTEEFEMAFNLLYPLARNHSTNRKVVEAMGVCVLRLPFLPQEVPDGLRIPVMKAGQAFTYGALEDSEHAMASFEDLVRSFPDLPNAHYAFGQYLRVRNDDRALEEFRAELAVSPGHLPARLQIAWHFITRGRPAEALPYANEVLKARFDSYSARYVLGKIYFELDQTDRAISQLEAASAAVPGSTEVRSLLAQAYWKAGRTEDARKQLAEIQRIRSLQLEAEQQLVGGDVRP